MISETEGPMSPGSSHQHGGGPGVGVRLNSYRTPRTSHIRCVQPSLVDRDAAKAEKFKTLLAETNIDLGKKTKTGLI